MAKYILLFIFVLIFAAGCADVNAPSPERLLPPWGASDSLRLGDSKDLVRNYWGDPDEIIDLGVDDVGLPREEWVYTGKYPIIEGGSRLFTKTSSLIFTGNALTGYKAVTPATEDNTQE